MKLHEIFLEKEIGKANKELDCYGYCLDNAVVNFLNAEFEKAAAYHENAARSLRELQQMKNTKQMQDKAWFMLKQIKAKQQQEELIFELRSRI